LIGAKFLAGKLIIAKAAIPAAKLAAANSALGVSGTLYSAGVVKAILIGCAVTAAMVELGVCFAIAVNYGIMSESEAKDKAKKANDLPDWEKREMATEMKDIFKRRGIV